MAQQYRVTVTQTNQKRDLRVVFISTSTESQDRGGFEVHHYQSQVNRQIASPYVGGISNDALLQVLQKLHAMSTQLVNEPQFINKSDLTTLLWRAKDAVKGQ